MESEKVGYFFMFSSKMVKLLRLNRTAHPRQIYIMQISLVIILAPRIQLIKPRNACLLHPFQLTARIACDEQEH